MSQAELDVSSYTSIVRKPRASNDEFDSGTVKKSKLEKIQNRQTKPVTQPKVQSNCIVIEPSKLQAVHTRSQNKKALAGKRRKWQKEDDKERANGRAFKQDQQDSA